MKQVVLKLRANLIKFCGNVLERVVAAVLAGSILVALFPYSPIDQTHSRNNGIATVAKHAKEQ